MKFYFAPMEGITGYIYRNAYQKYFHNVDQFVTPFISPNKNQSFNSRERNDILPEHNAGTVIVPQILTNQAEAFIRTAQELQQMGYQEVNLNLGCPSQTVVTKKKGAGFLAVPDQLEHFLEQIFSALSMHISIKTRIGLCQAEEFYDLLELYNQFPLTELIIHPRLQTDFYQNKPDWHMFGWALKESKNPICYNGDIFTTADYQSFRAAFPEVDCIMLGRGILRNPGLVDEICNAKSLQKNTLKEFHDEILFGYQEAFSGDRPVLFKMKELWCYLLPLFTGSEKYKKKIRKTERIKEYQQLIEHLWAEQELR